MTRPYLAARHQGGQLHSATATALMENTTLEVEERTFGLDIVPLLLASALAVILGQNDPVVHDD